MAAASLALPASSEAELYWANGSGFPFDATTISRATIGGDSINPSFISGYKNPTGVAVNLDATHVYWAAGGPNTAPSPDPAAIGRANIDGGSPTQDWIENDDCEFPGAQHLNQPYNLAIDSTHIYWIDWASSQIGRATLDRTGPNDGVDCDWFSLNPYSPGYVSFFGVAVDDEYVYWTKAGDPAAPDYGSIGRVQKDGSNPIPDFIGGTPGTNLGDVRAVAVNSSGIFWIDSRVASRIGTADLNGSDVNLSFVTSIDASDGITLDDEFIYWSYFAPPPNGAIGRVGLDGLSPDQNFISSLNYPKGIYVTYASGSVTPANRDFGEAEAGGGPTGSLTVTLEASGGNVPLTIDSGGITRTGTDPGDFQVTGGTCVAGTTALATGQSCTVEVVFEPSSVGAKSATLRIATNDGPFTSSLSGTGTEAPDPGPVPGPDPGPVPGPKPNFTQVRISTKAKGVKVPRKGRTQVTVTARVTNSGDGAGSAAVSLRSSSPRVKVPGQLAVEVKAGASSTKRFRATVLPRAPRKVTLTARLPDGKSARLVLKLRR